VAGLQDRELAKSKKMLTLMKKKSYDHEGLVAAL